MIVDFVHKLKHYIQMFEIGSNPAWFEHIMRTLVILKNRSRLLMTSLEASKHRGRINQQLSNLLKKRLLLQSASTTFKIRTSFGIRIWGSTSNLFRSIPTNSHRTNGFNITRDKMTVVQEWCKTRIKVWTQKMRNNQPVCRITSRLEGLEQCFQSQRFCWIE